jgi:hypothetical protein
MPHSNYELTFKDTRAFWQNLATALKNNSKVEIDTPFTNSRSVPKNLKDAFHLDELKNPAWIDMSSPDEAFVPGGRFQAKLKTNNKGKHLWKFWCLAAISTLLFFGTEAGAAEGSPVVFAFGQFIQVMILGASMFFAYLAHRALQAALEQGRPITIQIGVFPPTLHILVGEPPVGLAAGT